MGLDVLVICGGVDGRAIGGVIGIAGNLIDKDAAFSQYPRSKLMGYSMRSGTWRYTEWINRKTGKVEARELYDHAKSPVASRNLAGEPRHADKIKRLSSLLDGGKGWKTVREGLAEK